MQDLADIASNIAEGDYKKGNLKALPTERIDDYGSVARSISQISEDLKNQIKMIAKQRDQFGSVLDDLGEGILVTNKNGDVVFANEQFSIILNIVVEIVFTITFVIIYMGDLDSVFTLIVIAILLILSLIIFNFYYYAIRSQTSCFTG